MSFGQLRRENPQWRFSQNQVADRPLKGKICQEVDSQVTYAQTRNYGRFTLRPRSVFLRERRGIAAMGGRGIGYILRGLSYIYMYISIVIIAKNVPKPGGRFFQPPCSAPARLERTGSAAVYGFIRTWRGLRELRRRRSRGSALR